MRDELSRLKQGLERQRAGAADEAERVYRSVLAGNADCVPALNLLGALCINTGRAGEAVALISRALELSPGDPQGYLNLGLALRNLERLEEAGRALSHSLAIRPQHALARNCMGSVLLDSGKPAEAIEHFNVALELNRDYAECLSNKAQALKRLGQGRAALEAAERAVALEPANPEMYIRAAELLRGEGMHRGAIEHYSNALQREPGSLSARLGLANTYREAGRTEEALAALDDCLQHHPHSAEAYSALGLVREQLGEIEAAAQNYERAIALDASKGRFHYQLAQLKHRRSTDEELSALERTTAGLGDSDSDDAMYAAFARACVYEERGRWDEAFDAWSEGNAINASRYAFNFTRREGFYREAVRCAQQMRARLGDLSGKHAYSPVFIVGMPRSGTTLTGQIVAAHSQVYSLGETSAAHEMTRSLEDLSGTSYPQALAEASAEDLATLQKAQLESSASRCPPDTVVLDVTPTNFQHLGLLALALPGARFVHCRRDPIDTCLSIFKIPFGGGQDYAHDLVALGQQYRSYHWLMEQWRLLFGERVLDVRYEETVADTEAQTRKILAFLGLDYEEGVLDFHRSGALVRTPSAAQVRQPVYGDAVRRWRRYRHRLAPLIDALGDVIEDGAGNN